MRTTFTRPRMWKRSGRELGSLMRTAPHGYESLHAAILQWIAQRRNVVLACSALKRSYRSELDAGPDVRFVYLKGSAPLIASRLQARRGHFANQQILASQLSDLEEPENTVTVGIAGTPLEIVQEIRNKLALE